MSSNLTPSASKYNPINEKLAIILNHSVFKNEQKRVGTEKDVVNLIWHLIKMKCNYAVFNNLKKKVILEDVPKYVECQNLDKIDGLLVFILTHGDAQNNLQAADYGYDLFKFINKFNSENCKILANKPKLFFISACRGHEFQTMHTVTFISDGIMATDATPTQTQRCVLYPNLLLAFGTFASTYGIRHEFYGTRFIKALCEIFDEFIRNTPEDAEIDIIKLLLKTNNKLIKIGEGNAKQLAQVFTTLSAPYLFRKSNDF